jgi:hypothetical protein
VTAAVILAIETQRDAQACARRPRRKNPTMKTWPVLGALSGAAALVAAGCGGGNDAPSEIGGLTAYHAASVARDAMDDEVIERESVAYDGNWVIEKTVAERRSDGGWAWRVEFVDVSGEAGPVCIWIQLDDRTLANESFTYEIDRYPAPATT